MKILCYQGTFGNFLINDVCNPPTPPSKTSKMCAVYILYRETQPHTHSQTGSRGDILYKFFLAGLRPESQH